jgi:hypothetical protein
MPAPAEELPPWFDPVLVPSEGDDLVRRLKRPRAIESLEAETA